MSNNETLISAETPISLTNPESLDSLIQELSSTKEKFQATSKAILAVLFQTFLKENPEVEGITWTQYVPYYNDGDACVFRVREAEFLIAKDTPGWYESDYLMESENEELAENDSPFRWQTWSSWRSKEIPNANVKLGEVCQALEGAMQLIKAQLEDTFGEHSHVTVLKDGRIIREDHQHD